MIIVGIYIQSVVSHGLKCIGPEITPKQMRLMLILIYIQGIITQMYTSASTSPRETIKTYLYLKTKLNDFQVPFTRNFFG